MLALRIILVAYLAVIGLNVASLFRFHPLSTLLFVYASLLPALYVLIDSNPVRRLVVSLVGAVWYLHMFLFFDSVFATPVMNNLYNAREFMEYRGGGHQFGNLSEYGSNFMYYLTNSGFNETLLSLPAFLVCCVFGFYALTAILKSNPAA